MSLPAPAADIGKVCRTRRGGTVMAAHIDPVTRALVPASSRREGIEEHEIVGDARCAIGRYVTASNI
jgi:hypothetical protein